MKRHLPPLNALRAFEAAARLGRMTAAADELSVTPGAISRQVQQLETHLGVPLFEGPKNKPHLTNAGKLLLPALSGALDSIEAAVLALRNSDSATVDVLCFSTFAVKWLIPRLFDFNARHPNTEIRLRTAEHIASPERERCDVAITVEEETAVLDPASAVNATLLPLFPERLGPVLAPSLATNLQLRTAVDLNCKTLLRTRTRENAWQVWANAYGCAAPANDGPVYEHYYFTLQATVAGLGICVAPWHLVADDVQAGHLLAPLGFCDSGYHYVAKRRVQDNPACTQFCDWLQEQANLTSATCLQNITL